jgi:hypothetical protein
LIVGVAAGDRVVLASAGEDVEAALASFELLRVE